MHGSTRALGAIGFLATALLIGILIGFVIAGPRPPTGTDRVKVKRGVEAGPGGRCGIERWRVKTLTDPGASKVNLDPVASTVSALGVIPAPVDPDALTGRAPEELHAYRVRALILGAKLEADSDIHLALEDPAHPTATMIAELPAYYCDSGSRAKDSIDAARNAFVAAYGLPPSIRFDHTLTGCVTVTGVFFFDRIHGQLGVAPNGAELHPVLAFKRGCP